VAIADNGGDAGECGEFLWSALGIAAGDDDAGFRIDAVGSADEGARGAIGLGGDGAGVYDDHVCAGRLLRGVPGGIQMAANGLAIGARGATAEIFNVKAGHAPSLGPVNTTGASLEAGCTMSPMNFSVAFSGSIAGDFLLAGLILIALKLISAAVQTVLMRGDYRTTPQTAFFRAVYITGKVTPFLALACVATTAILEHNRAAGWFYGAFAIFIALVAAYVVLLRRRGRFFGVLDLVTRKRK